MDAPLYTKLRAYEKKKNYPFHMPGHKGGRLGSFDDVFSIDITEIDGFDNLHNATGVIKEAQEMTAKLFGAYETHFLVNGSTSGILAAILAVCGDEEEILVARNCHRSVFSAMILSGAKPIYIMPDILDNGLIGGVSQKAVEKLVIKHKNAKAIIITSPTYEGFTSDTKKIADIVHKNNMILIVDEAHGACFKFHEKLPTPSLFFGADIVIQSMHKTLPALTQTALLHLGSNRVDKSRLSQALSMVQTSSPSYVLMASIDYCNKWLLKEGKMQFATYIENIEWFRKEMRGIVTFRLCGRELIGFSDIYDVDIGRLVFIWDGSLIDAFEVEKYLRQEWGIVLELCDMNHFIAITTPADNREAFELLKNAVIGLEKKFENTKYLSAKKNNLARLEILELVVKCNPRKAFFSQKKSVCLDDSCGMISGETVIPYPPGIPLIVAGEIISDDVIERIRLFAQNGVSLLGLKDNTFTSIDIIE